MWQVLGTKTSPWNKRFVFYLEQQGGRAVTTLDFGMLVSRQDFLLAEDQWHCRILWVAMMLSCAGNGQELPNTLLDAFFSRTLAPHLSIGTDSCAVPLNSAGLVSKCPEINSDPFTAVFWRNYFRTTLYHFLCSNPLFTLQQSVGVPLFAVTCPGLPCGYYIIAIIRPEVLTRVTSFQIAQYCTHYCMTCHLTQQYAANDIHCYTMWWIDSDNQIALLISQGCSHLPLHAPKLHTPFSVLRHSKHCNVRSYIQFT